jgi:hypothetical protein
MKLLKIENYKTSQILLAIVIIILLVPPILTLPSISEYFDFTTTGQIGDTIGGLTAPFINGLAAILVFIAFKEQIRANEIFKNQEKSRTILEQITLIQDDKLKIEEVIFGLINRAEYLKQPDTIQITMLMNKIIYFIAEIRLTNELIKEHTGDKDFLYKKLYFLYVIRYKDLILKLGDSIENQKKIHADYEIYKIELVTGIQYLNKNLDNVNKYSDILSLIE